MARLAVKKRWGPNTPMACIYEIGGKVALLSFENRMWANFHWGFETSIVPNSPGGFRYMYLIEEHFRPDEAKNQKTVRPKKEGKLNMVAFPMYQIELNPAAWKPSVRVYYRRIFIGGGFT